MTTLFEDVALSAARSAGLFRLLRTRHRHALLALTYHSVVEAEATVRERHPLVYRNAVDAERFEAHMRHLRRHYCLLDGDALRAVLDGDELPERAVVVTFDDALLNNVTVALPILRDLDVPAFFFLPTGFVEAASEGRRRLHWSEDLVARLSLRSAEHPEPWAGVATHLPTLNVDVSSLSVRQAILRVVDHLKSLSHARRTDRVNALRETLDDFDPDRFPADAAGHSILDTMSWTQARRAASEGITLGSHTVNHEILSRLPDDEAAAEIAESRRHIDEQTSASADLLAYPNGRPRDFTSTHQDLLAQAGYRGAFTQISGFNDASTHALALRRINVSENHDLSAFCYLASGTKHWVDRLVRRRRPGSRPEVGEHL